MLTVISLGWGVQSFTMAAMSALGELPPVDFAIHADTTWERSSTYEFVARWAPWLEEHGVRVVTVRNENKQKSLMDSWKGIRDKRPPYPLYVHRSCKPLAEAVVIPEDFGYTQLDLLQVPEDMPCDSGYCFL